MFGAFFFEVTLRLVGWQEEKLQKIGNGKKKIGEDIDQNSLIEQNVFCFRKSGKVFRFFYFAENFFLSLGEKAEKQKDF